MNEPTSRTHSAWGKPAAAVVALLALGWIWLRAGVCDYLILEVHYLQGSKITEETFNVGIRRDRIAYIGKQRIRARRTIAGNGMILTPGFMDVNSCGWLTESAAMLKLKDGITTYLNAHGDSFRATASANHASEKLNYATSVGLIPVFDGELKGSKMIAALEDSLRHGAYTISLSPEYTAQTTIELVAELSKHFAHKNVLFTFHLRYSSGGEELAGVKEAIACAAQGNPVHILHVASTGATFHPEEAKQMIDAAVRQGMKISYDFYPYTTWASSIHRARFEGDWRGRYRVDFQKVHIAGEGELTESRFEELRHSSQEHMVMVDSIPQATVDFFALETQCPIGTDSEANPRTSHPRGAGSFTKFVNDYVDTGRVDFGVAMHRFSTATANLYAAYIPGLADRGAIEAGRHADLVLWDRARIKSQADFTNPHKPSVGVVAAFVNGVPLILGGELVNSNASPGRHLKGAWAR